MFDLSNVSGDGVNLFHSHPDLHPTRGRRTGKFEIKIFHPHPDPLPSREREVGRVGLLPSRVRGLGVPEHFVPAKSFCLCRHLCTAGLIICEFVRRFNLGETGYIPGTEPLVCGDSSIS
jgi:hypothetical protein